MITNEKEEDESIDMDAESKNDLDESDIEEESDEEPDSELDDLDD